MGLFTLLFTNDKRKQVKWNDKRTHRYFFRFPHVFLKVRIFSALEIIVANQKFAQKWVQRFKLFKMICYKFIELSFVLFCFCNTSLTSRFSLKCIIFVQRIKSTRKSYFDDEFKLIHYRRHICHIQSIHKNKYISFQVQYSFIVYCNLTVQKRCILVFKDSLNLYEKKTSSS